MKDMMMEVYNVLSADPTIAKEVTAKNIKFYEVPESFDSTKPFIIIDTPLDRQLVLTMQPTKRCRRRSAIKLMLKLNQGF